MVAIFTKMAAFTAVIGGARAAAVNVQQIPLPGVGTPVNPNGQGQIVPELLLPPKSNVVHRESTVVKPQDTTLRQPPAADPVTKHAPAVDSLKQEVPDIDSADSDDSPSTTPAETDSEDSPKKDLSKKSSASKKSKVVSSLSADMRQEDRAIKSLTRALDHYASISKKTQEIIAEQAKAEQNMEGANKDVEDATAALHDAKAKRFEAAKLDMLTNPLTSDTSRKRLASTDQLVATAEQRYEEVQKSANAAESAASRATDKAKIALGKQAEYEERLKAAGHEAESLSKAVQRAQEKDHREEDKIDSAVTVLEKQKKEMEAAMDKATKQSAQKMATHSESASTE